MNLFRKSLNPLSLIYDAVTRIRNIAYDLNWFKHQSFDIPTIVVGNLSTGGSGKTPMIEYLLRRFSNQHSVAVLSRGYKRQSDGFVIGDHKTSVKDLGDEPFQLAKKFPHVKVAVSKNRPLGIQKLLTTHSSLDAVFLDDGYQHRKLKPSFQILLTTYASPWFNDCVLPAGNLRESSKGKNRADVIVVTKCPDDLSNEEQNKFAKQLRINVNQKLFFTSISYDSVVQGDKKMQVSSFVKKPFVLVTGIANPKPLISYLDDLSCEYTHFEFPDHHFFSASDLKKITSLGLPILTTEKDYVRIGSLLEKVFFLPIALKFLGNEEKFLTSIENQFC